ncbi:uncharacterized protein CANTADRAFT_27702 [Suhomyces tanzawaensis NRRL Y-17324]|uniref:Nucleoporin NUP60 n=1 Tax=Suhomyces tanzawaensis NRRL Y-17324 TaxID=984487 RepID=A0A1E4SAW6_9ASCO|nr:uncharacterized protein CANTADRAFT_27702 [Suhomyces tanzawaensis NRRL Y-17324]ODV76667.1 hypothetical protein CANTADRAFT_27702 [Suhomyces tanzawaensis NRRL Y-17324]
MDNRKSYRAYKEKLRVASAPYPTSGLFSKVKRLFSPRTIWKAPSKDNELASKEPNPSTARSNSHVEAFQYPAPKFNPILRSASTSSFKMPGSFDTNSSPNKVLSNFFQQKGDEPLTQVEYEGIVSLINKSKSEIGNETQSNDQDANNTFFKDTSIRDKLFLYDTPYTQKILKKDSNTSGATYSTPDYKPIYHTVNETSASIPSVKRVYQFSGLPSPYRTRIRAPSLSKKTNSNASKNGLIIENNNNTTTNTSTTQYRPRSEAANTLLSILDGDLLETTTEDLNNKDIKRFSNPYSSSQNRKRTKTSKQAPLTSKDISSTLLFDKSAPLPVEKDEEKIVPKPKSTVSKDASGQIEQKTISSAAKLDFSKPIVINEPVVNDGQLPEKKTFDFNFGKSNSNSVEKSAPLNFLFKPDQSAGKKQENIGFTIQHKANPVVGGTSVIEKTEVKAPYSYQFSVPEQYSVTLNREEVDSYKSLFSF